MVVSVCADKRQAGRRAAALFAAQVVKKPRSVLGLATGSSVLPVYDGMIKDFEDGLTDYACVTTFNLDEYCGLDPKHKKSFSRFMVENLFSKLNIPAESVHIPNGKAPDPDAYCAEYDAAIEAAGGIDLQLLGIGRNGHIAFNEPGEYFRLNTHVVTLTETTIADNARFFDDPGQVPKRAVTMGIGTIMKARGIILTACGKEKAAAVRSMLCGYVNPACPASILQLHPRVTIIIDEELNECLN
jgi:glucosamine-6-phosphate deaminase